MRLAPLGHLGLARGEHALLLRRRERARLVGGRLRLGLRPATARPPRSRAAARPARSPGGARSPAPARRAPSRCAPPRPRARTARRARSTVSRAAICARSASCSLSRRSRATSARCAARCVSSSRSWREPRSLERRGRCRATAARSPGSCCGSGSSCPARCRCAIFLRRSICSVSRVRPSASKALDGLKNSIAVWSSWVSDTVSSSSPFCSRSAATTARTRFTYSPRFSCISSMVISAATVRSASTNLPSTSSFSVSGCMRALAERLRRRGDRFGRSPARGRRTRR